MSTLKQCIETYILAKDGNRPHLMNEAFAVDAELFTRVKTDDIAFPPHIEGCEAITSVMVSQFAQRYENVYTFCVGEPEPDAVEFVCNWLVCMTGKASGAPRLGFGQYEWHGGARLISRLTITIEEMRVLDRAVAAPLFAWVSTMPYPWCTVDQLEQRMPRIDSLERVIRKLRAGGRCAPGR